ncbi:MAG TPA: serine hydrolase [Usitatibacter sp.]|nr:serine hydrolase [Usitatibacter sp.]
MAGAADNLIRPIPVGSASFVVIDPRPGPRREITVFTHRPASYKPGSPVLIVLHGRNRNGADYRDWFVAEAERRGFLVAAPQFDEAQYAHPWDYNYGAMIGADGQWRPRELWIGRALEAVFAEVERRSGSTRERWSLFGHSAGGQLVHRLCTFDWPGRIDRAVSANAGSYTLPVADEAFPFGLAGAPVGDAELSRFFGRELLVLLGTHDDDPKHYQLPDEPGAVRQGPHRFARGLRYLEVARREAARLGVPLAWKVATAPGVAHSAKNIAPFAAKHLFESWPGADWAPMPAPSDRGWSAEGLEAARRKSEEIGSAAVMIVQDGLVVAQWGDVAHRYKCHSIRKSLLSALVGLHVEDGDIDLNKTLGELGIDDHEPLSPREKAAKIIDLLMARSGVYHPAGYETEYMRNLKPARHAHGPGTWWCYNNWDFNALGTLFEKLTGRGIFDDFRDRIAQPLAMQDFRYGAQGRDGEYVEFKESMHRAYPFRVSTRDLARFGLLFLRGGRWRDQQVVPEKWVRMRVRPYSHAGERGGYGYMWWVARGDIHFPQMSVPEGTYSARGAGGHYVVVIPALDLVVVHRADTDVLDRKVEGLAFGALLEAILAARR